MTLAFAPTLAQSSPLVRWDARWKLAALGLFALVIATLSHVAPLIVALLVVAFLIVYSHLPWRDALERLGMIALGLLPFLILLPLTATNGWATVIPLALRGLALGLLALVLVETTPMTRLFEALHSLGLPNRLVWVMQLAYRYIFVLFAEVRRIRVATRTRGFQIRTNSHTYRTLGNMAGAIVVRGGDHAEQVAAAMRCRGFDGQIHIRVPFVTTRNDVLGFLLIVGIAAALGTWNALAILLDVSPPIAIGR